MLTPLVLSTLLLLCIGLSAFLAKRYASWGIRSFSTRRGETGQGLVEMAILLPMFLVLLAGVVEVANGLNAYMTVVNSARDGARVASKGNADDTTVEALVATEMASLRNANSDVDVAYVTLGTTEAVKVTACYDHTPILNVRLVMPDKFTMCSSTSMRLFSDDK